MDNQTLKSEGGNLAASKIRNLECPNYEICLIDYGCGKFNRKIHIMEQYYIFRSIPVHFPAAY